MSSICDDSEDEFCEFHGEYWANHGDQTHGEIHLLKLIGARECVQCERYGCADHFPDDDPYEESKCVDCRGNHP